MSLLGPSNALVGILTARDTALGDAGNYFTAVNPTPGTGIASAAAPTTLVETTPVLVIYNGSQNLNIDLVAIRLLDTAHSTGGTGINFTHSLDNGNRYSSGGTALTINNVNSASTNTSLAVINFGAVTATAKSSKQRNLGNLMFRPTVIDATGDKYEIQYGEGATGSVNPVDGTAASHLVIGVPPVIIAPGWSYLINLWKASMSAAVSFEVEIDYVEK